MEFIQKELFEWIADTQVYWEAGNTFVTNGR